MSSTPRYTVVSRIPVGLLLLMTVIGFVLVLTGVTVLQVVGFVDLLVILLIAFFGPKQRIEPKNAIEQQDATRDHEDSREGNVTHNSHPHTTNGTRPVVAGPRRDAEESRRRARQKREESAGAPGR